MDSDFEIPSVGMVIEIPLKDSDEVIELDVTKLPEVNDLVEILTQENAPLKTWFEVALEYYRQGRDQDYLRALEIAQRDASRGYKDSDKDHMRVLDSLAAYYVKQANKERIREKKREYFSKATLLYTAADKILTYDQNHLLGKAFFCILEGNKLEQGDAQFNFVLGESPSCIPALLGKACLAFHKKDYRGALAFYKKVLRTYPACPTEVRVALGHCFMKLGNKQKAELAYQRALEINPNCVEALVALAIHFMNIREKNLIRTGVVLLSRAYNWEPTNPLVLNHLADHFFFKKDFEKVNQLAAHAMRNTENEAILAESCYHIARSLHIQGDFESASQYYFQSTQYCPSFVLAHFGFGLMYIHRGDGDVAKAAMCFKKVLELEPDNIETLKIMGSLYADSKNESERELAKGYLKKVTAREPDDVEAWIELAQLLEPTNPQESLKNYDTAVKLFRAAGQVRVPPEVLNNIGSLHYRLGNHVKAQDCFKEALNGSRAETGEDQSYSLIAVTITYNLARVHEALYNDGEAEKLYKDILKEHPNYVDCYLRLGCMSRDRGHIYDASDWYKEALQVDNEHPDAWALIGNLHISKQEWGPGQKKFERILKNPETKNDPYSMIALGNVWLQTLHTNSRDKEKDKRHQERALNIFSAVLKEDPKNIWAANGIGCILAHKGFINEARDIFSQVREATADFCDVWLNIAHIYVEQYQFVSAIQMYENCMKKFFKGHSVEILQYLARAYYKSGKLKEAKLSLLKARRISPTDELILYNLALILQKLATQTLRDDKSTLQVVLVAVHELSLSRKYFQYLHGNNEADGRKHDLRSAAAAEAQHCQDLISQAKYHVARARKLDEEEKWMRRRQEEEREAFRMRQLEEKQKLEELERRQKEEMLRKRQEYKEKTKAVIAFVEPSQEVKEGSKKGSRRKDEDIVADGSVDETEASRMKRKSKSDKEKPEESGRKRKKSEGRKRKEKKGRKRKGRKKKDGGDRKRVKPRKKIVSRTTVSTDSDTEEEPSQKSVNSKRTDDNACEDENTGKRVISSSDSEPGENPNAQSK